MFFAKNGYNYFMNKSFTIIVAFILSSIVSAFNAKADVIDEVTTLLKSGNAKELSRFFAPTVELTVLTEEDEYPKAQAEAVLKSFFSKNAPSSIKVLHKITSNPNHRFAVISLVTSAGTFRTSITLKNFSGKFLITELRIEED